MSAHSITSRGLAGRKIPQGTLTPMGALLFAASEQGAWYDPSDMSTLFQDSAGTAPVTAVEQPVGRMLDKSGRGNHASQATTTKRPVLSARVNLLVATGNIMSASWAAAVGAVKNGANEITISASAAVYQAFAITPVAGLQIVWSAVTNTAKKIITFGGATPPGTDVYTLLSRPDGKYLQKIVRTLSGAAGGVTQAMFESDTATDAGTYLVEEMDLRLAMDSHLPYQYVNTATDYDADPAKFPAYLRFDGVDDEMQTENIDLSYTDKLFLTTGAAKLADGGAQILIGNSAGTTSAGGFQFRVGGGGGTAAKASFYARGSSSFAAAAVIDPAPNTRVWTGIADVGVTSSFLRRDGVQISQNSVAQAPTNFVNGAVTLFANMNGRFYGLVLRGGPSTLTQIEATETYMRGRMKL